jgi:hypothetical protein
MTARGYHWLVAVCLCVGAAWWAPSGEAADSERSRIRKFKSRCLKTRLAIAYPYLVEGGLAEGQTKLAEGMLSAVLWRARSMGPREKRDLHHQLFLAFKGMLSADEQRAALRAVGQVKSLKASAVFLTQPNGVKVAQRQFDSVAQFAQPKHVNNFAHHFVATEYNLVNYRLRESLLRFALEEPHLERKLSQTLTALFTTAWHRPLQTAHHEALFEAYKIMCHMVYSGDLYVRGPHHDGFLLGYGVN